VIVEVKRFASGVHRHDPDAGRFARPGRDSAQMGVFIAGPSGNNTGEWHIQPQGAHLGD
jgi:hypothetical protein